jgi:hypothetical protein
LTKDEIQKVVSGINTQVANEHKRAAATAALGDVAKAAQEGDADKCFAALKNPLLGLEGTVEDSR